MLRKKGGMPSKKMRYETCEQCCMAVVKIVLKSTNIIITYDTGDVQ